MLTQSELAKQFYELDENPRAYKPTDYGNELPEYPVLRPLGQVLHYPCIIKGNICLPGRNPRLYKQFGQTERRKEDY